MYNYSYEIYQTLISIYSYLTDYIFPCLLCLIFLCFILFAINLLRWFKR